MNKSRAPKNTSQPLVSIIILNWNGIEDTLNCLKSLEKLDYSNYEVIVVDNGSVDGSKKVLSTTRNITYVDNPQNAGFTGGHIIGQKHAKGEYIFILNNDTVVAPEYLKEAVKLLEKDTSIGAVGGRSYRLKSVQDEYDTSLPFYSYQKINLFTGEGIFKQHDDGRVIEVNNISGSAAVIRHSTIKSVGYFYSPFFAYYEETDLFARMKRAGHKVVYSPNLHIWHKDGSSSSSYFQYKQLYRNRLLFVLRNFDKIPKPMQLVVLSF